MWSPGSTWSGTLGHLHLPHCLTRLAQRLPNSTFSGRHGNNHARLGTVVICICINSGRFGSFRRVVNSRCRPATTPLEPSSSRNANDDRLALPTPKRPRATLRHLRSNRSQLNIHTAVSQHIPPAEITRLRVGTRDSHGCHHHRPEPRAGEHGAGARIMEDARRQRSGHSPQAR